MKSKNYKLSLILHLFLLFILSSCSADTTISSTETDDTTTSTEQKTISNDSSQLEVPEITILSDWSSETHEKLDTPNYDVVFDQTKVLRFDITITAKNWEAMQSDLADNLGTNSSGNRPPMGGGMQTAMVTEESDFDPLWVPCSFNFEGKEWYSVGIRYKGNSSLSSAYGSGNNKLSFKLDFDEFEGDVPEIKNQRFYGFKQLNLNNNFDDQSLMREKIGADLFREFGLVSAKTTFCVVYIDNGSGSQYYGVYTFVEEVHNTVIENQLGDDSGNLYKPDGDAASFAANSYNDDEMEKKSNEAEADYSDVKALYTALNAESRTTDVEQWKSDLEAVFDVDGFLKWLAVNTTIQNWDTYGNMTHNYYLYNNPANGLLTWIPWDNNEAFQEGKMSGALSLSLDEVSNDWPLIRYIIDIEEYKATYDTYLKKFIDEVFTEASLTAKYDTYYALLKEYAYSEEQNYTFIQSSASFDAAVETLKGHVQSRNSVIETYLTN